MTLAEGKCKRHEGGERSLNVLNVAPHLVRIHIDREPYDSPNPTSGIALYTLADIVKHEKLYREVEGDKEDELFRAMRPPVHLKQDGHFYSQKVIEILVNGDDHEIDTKEITYTRVVKLYLGSGGKPSNEYLVKYSMALSRTRKELCRRVRK